MINCQQLSYNINEEIIIEQFSLKLKPKERVAIIGPSGCGKSTILKLLLGIKEHTSGTLQVTPSKLAYMPQNDLLLPWLTIGENICLPLEAQAIKCESKKVAEQLAHFKVDASAEQYPHELSGGMKSRINLIRALNMSEELLLLDEPFSKLDYLTHLEITEWFKEELKNSELAILLVTHNIEEAIKLCDRIIVLSQKPARITTEFLTCEYSKEELKRKIIENLF